VRQVREANPSLYREVKAGRRSLNSALAEISPPRDRRIPQPGAGKSQAGFGEGGQKLARQEATAPVELPPSPAAIQKALARVKTVLGNWFYAEVKAMNLIQKPGEIVQFAKLTDAQMLEIGPLLKRGWTFAAASREVVERLTPDDEIRAIHTRAIENGKNWYLLSIGDFMHVVVWGTDKDKTLSKVKDTLARTIPPQRS
jgi:hypothetical protein